jgi:hypothetical protein
MEIDGGCGGGDRRRTRRRRPELEEMKAVVLDLDLDILPR